MWGKWVLVSPQLQPENPGKEGSNLELDQAIELGKSQNVRGMFSSEEQGGKGKAKS